ncbi:precorrin-3B synthase [Methylocystis sp. H4A]|uniref:precorrin-3B synthase n=1 Tax=Methylocystis sp. H4A TaxID=2785788 RepID=UPI0018C27722|nr:precorrin-3B synthase [Methylocystis sp. H4A]MBG0803358.1 precorrin-3B synthase [Methylocystis sp. H4A]
MQPRPEIKGWCPGAFAPMPSGDGLLIRAKAVGSRMSAAQAREIARIADNCGNGLIDLSQRAQLQLRGISEATIAEALRGLEAIGMLAPSADAERVTNVIASPLAGLVAGAFDANVMAVELAAELQRDAALRALPPKFLFLLDDGGALSLADVEADIRIEAIANGDVAIRIAGVPDRAVVVAAGDALDVALRFARAFVELRDRHANSFRRVRTLVEALGADALPRAAGLVMRVSREAPAPASRAHIYGAQRCGALAFAGVGAPFGRWRADELAAVADLAQSEGTGELRLTPWRALLIVTPDKDNARRVVSRAQDHDLITSADDKRLAVIACPGAPECPQAIAETRAHVMDLAPLAQMIGGADGVGLHLSGCAKGCARQSASPITLLANAEGFDLIENAGADGAPSFRSLTFEAVMRELSARASGRTQ